MNIEIFIYLLIASLCFAYRTVLSGRKNGCFYTKNNIPLPPFLEREIKNIHYIETPAWYAQSIGHFMLLLSIARLINPSYDIYVLAKEIGIAALITLGTIHAASYHYQRGITAGLRDDEHLDYINKSEVALKLWFIHIRFYKFRLFNNRGRIVAQWLGVVEILIGCYLLLSGSF